ncbi:hypothetical protein QSH57_004728 [Fusarium oxysporum f. sp. vasinfectum]|nr:hypothetical protein QSH57_004728 [Fusarium oxysporum f. sp. vasinfectum]
MAESPIISSMVLEPPDKEDKKNSWDLFPWERLPWLHAIPTLCVYIVAKPSFGGLERYAERGDPSLE